jgi:HK97 family phage major capsid protein/HK97 family phage prohead protease
MGDERGRPEVGEVEERTAPEGELTVEGNTLHGLIPYDTTSHDFGGWQERMAPGCLRNADTSKLVVRVDHGGLPLGRFPTTMTMEDRSDGMHWSCDLPDSPTGHDVREAVRRGDLAGTSWRMVVARDAWDGNVRTVQEVRDLRDVSVCTTPAYPTRAELRSHEHTDEQEDAMRPEDQEDRGGDDRAPEDEDRSTEDRIEDRSRGGGLRVEDRAARPDGESVETRVLDAMRDVPAGEERDLTRVTAVPVEPQELSTFLWDLLRPFTVVLASGVRTIDTQRKSVKWPVLTGDITANYVSELEEIPESDPTFEDFELPVAKAIKALVKASAEALEDSDPDLLTVITQNLGVILGLKLDRELIAGSTTGGITGLLNIEGIQELDAGGESLADYDWYFKAAGMLQDAHVAGPYAVLMSTRVDTGLSLIKQFTSAGSNVPLGRPAGVPAPFVTSQMPVKTGTGGAPDTSDVLVYAPSRVVVLRRVGVDAAQVLVDRSEEFSRDAVLVKGRVRAGLGTPYPQSIVRIRNVASPAIDTLPMLTPAPAPAGARKR